MRKLNIPVWRIALILLAAFGITMHLSAGLYAKYTSRTDGDSEVRVANFDGGAVQLPQSSSQHGVSTVTKSGAHVFATSCEVVFDACEVTRRFTLTVSTTDEILSFACPEGSLYSLESCGGSTVFSKDDVECTLDLTSGKAYVALADITDGTASYTWYEATVSDDGKTLTAVSDKLISMDAQSYSVKLLYFSNLTNIGETYSEDVNISFNLNCEQVD